jgi:hypothetical protein
MRRKAGVKNNVYGKLIVRLQEPQPSNYSGKGKLLPDVQDIYFIIDCEKSF